MKLEGAAFDQISVVITSCGRADLLVKTLSSMTPWIHSFHEKIMIDDMSPEHLDVSLIAKEYGFSFIQNTQPLGQHRSIDIAYEQVSNPYIFHCEDDWEFFKMPDLELAKSVLEQAHISAMCFRKINDRSRSKYHSRTIDINRYQPAYFNNKKYLTIKKDWHPARGAFTFNPGLIKYSFYQQWGPYSKYPSETKISELLKGQGYLLAYEPEGSCMHIGWNRHVQDPMKPIRDHSFIGKLRKSCKKRIEKTLHVFDSHKNH